MRLALPIAAALLASCVAIVNAPHLRPDVQLLRVHARGDEIVVSGPMAVTYEMRVLNPSDEVMVLRRVDLRSAGHGFYHVTPQRRPIDIAIPPHSTAAVRLRVAAWANGGLASDFEPVTITGLLWFDCAGLRQRIAFESVP